MSYSITETIACMWCNGSTRYDRTRTTAPHGFVRNSWIADPDAVSKPPMLTARNTHGPGLYQSSGWDWRKKIEYGYNTQHCASRF
jgi:hypothetical protein